MIWITRNNTLPTVCLMNNLTLPMVWVMNNHTLQTFDRNHLRELGDIQPLSMVIFPC